MLVSDLIERFLNHHKRHHKAATVRFYRLGLRWLKRDFGSIDWNNIERDTLIGGLDVANMRTDGTPWKPDTIRRNLLAMEQLQKFGMDQYDLDPILRPRDLKKPPGNKREDIPTEAEMEAIFREARKRGMTNDQTPMTKNSDSLDIGHSSLVIYSPLELAFRSLAASGMRPNELCRATIADLNPERDLLTLKDHKTKGKTGKSKRVPFGDTLKELVAIATGERTEGPVWLDERGKAWTVGKLSTNFRVIKSRIGANEKLVLYSLRHWKGTQVAREWGILAASTILGHKQISTTQRYAHPNDDDARKWQG